MRTTLILGAGSDMAKAIAHRFARAGDQLLLAARRPDELSENAKDLQIRYQTNVHILEFDALDYESHKSFYASLPERPDVTVCVFGYLGDQEKARHEFEEASRILHTNFTGAVSILNIIADDYEKHGEGSMIGISSVAGDRGRQSNYIYGSAKAGFSAYLSGLRNRLSKSGVQVLTVKPGFVATSMTEGLDLPGAITATPEEAAEDIFKAFEKQCNVLYTMWMWRYIMCGIRSIPEFVFKKLSL